MTNLPDRAAVSVTCDGQDFAAVRVIGEDTIEIASDIDDHVFRLGVGADGEHSVPVDRRARSAGVSNPNVSAAPRVERSTADRDQRFTAVTRGPGDKLRLLWAAQRRDPSCHMMRAPTSGG